MCWSLGPDENRKLHARSKRNWVWTSYTHTQIPRRWWEWNGNGRLICSEYIIIKEMSLTLAPCTIFDRKLLSFREYCGNWTCLDLLCQRTWDLLQEIKWMESAHIHGGSLGCFICALDTCQLCIFNGSRAIHVLQKPWTMF